MVLHEKETSFIFATHFHEILKYDEVKALTQMALKHMAVHYDRELDCLVYDRVLQSGSGNRMYGLEVCKSLYLNEDFLNGAYALRNKYFPESRGELSNKATTYNAKKIRGVCENCLEELADEIHHINEQHLADENGFIGTFHKNHPANLMALCEKCHDKIHKGEVAKPARKKTTKGYVKQFK
jgi:DNA mismatch repair protein MutS